MRKIAANYIFPITSAPIKNGVVVIDDDGTVIEIIDNGGELIETQSLEFYNGILVPGLVNAHCHLELSYLKGKIEQNTGLGDFIKTIVQSRNKFEQTEESIKRADRLLKDNGIVAVGDISNVSSSFKVKSESSIYYHTFIELLGLNNDNTKELLEGADKLFQEAKNSYNINASIVPHAPYTVSENLFKDIFNHNKENNSIVSIHNQESEEENRMFETKEGKILDALKALNIDTNQFKASGKKSLETIFPLLYKGNNILLIHNTLSSSEDIQFAESLSENIYWVLCPNSNLYIENELPNIPAFKENNCKIALGTDSFASNTTLSIIDELKTINNNFSSIAFNEILQWATINGAKALNMERFLGSFDIGKKPGINLIENFNFADFKLTDKSTIKVLA